MQALRPLHRHLVSLQRRNEAERRGLERWAVPLAVVIHLPAELAVEPRILAWHVVGGGVGGAGIDHARLLTGLYGRRHVEALSWIRGGGEEERLAAGGGEGVPGGSEDEHEEEEHQAEERRRDEVQHAPLPNALGGWEVEVRH